MKRNIKLFNPYAIESLKFASHIAETLKKDEID